MRVAENRPDFRDIGVARAGDAGRDGDGDARGELLAFEVVDPDVDIVAECALVLGRHGEDRRRGVRGHREVIDNQVEGRVHGRRDRGPVVATGNRNENPLAADVQGERPGLGGRASGGDGFGPGGRAARVVLQDEGRLRDAVVLEEGDRLAVGDGTGARLEADLVGVGCYEGNELGLRTRGEALSNDKNLMGHDGRALKCSRVVKLDVYEGDSDPRGDVAETDGHGLGLLGVGVFFPAGLPGGFL